jgi:glycosyltransferase involved in cell wall biosynthesis
MLERLTFLVRARGYDAVVLQRELISTLPTLENLIPGPRIFDIDDAVYLRRGGHAARHAARSSFGVVCGNRELARRFSAWASRIAIIPTGVDTTVIRPLPEPPVPGPPVFGWIGTSANLPYLTDIAPSLQRVLEEVPGSEFHVIADRRQAIPEKLRPLARFTRWRPGIEADVLPRWTVGIMPLPDDAWTRGKCSFKLLQYLAAGIPAVASPVGMNGEVLAQDDVGHAAQCQEDWFDALRELLTEPAIARAKGARGRALVERTYSLQQVARQWRATLENWF